MRQNLHSHALAVLTVQSSETKLKEVKAALEQESISLTPTERHSILKMGPRSLAFVEKAHEFAEQNPSLRPPYLNMTAFDEDFGDAHNLWGLLSIATQIQEMISDTAMAAGSDAYYHALDFYKYVKTLAERDTLGARAVYEELKKIFPSKIKRSSSSDDGGGYE